MSATGYVAKMDEQHRGRVVAITGASDGIGRETALEFARADPSVRLVLLARRQEKLNEVKAEIQKVHGAGVKVHTQVLDVSDTDAVSKFVGQLPAEFQDIDVLVNNAGLATGGKSPPEIQQEDLLNMVNTNFIGLVNVTQAVLPGMIKKNSGDIVNITSVVATVWSAATGIYGATKAAVRSFSDSLRKQYIGSSLRVIDIAPGIVDTNFWSVMSGGKSSAPYQEGVFEPLAPADVAEIIVFAVTRSRRIAITEANVFPNHQAGLDIYTSKVNKF